MPANHFIQAIEDTELVSLSFDSLQQLYNHKLLSYKMERFGRLIAEYLICCYDDRLNSFIIQSPEERYLDLLSSRPDIIQRIPQHHIANFLGITPVSLSRIRRRVMKSAKKLPG
jgi:CRP-like cAMP-binding protein